MSSLRSWLRGASASSSPRASGSSSPAAASSTAVAEQGLSPVEREMSDIEDAMAAAALIMNDDIDGAEARLKLRRDGSVFHQLGLGVSTFMRSVLGFEKEIMAEASTRLLECETRAWADMKRAQKDAGGGAGWFGRAAANGPSTGASEIYPPGTEFALVHAEAELMIAIVSVMHESLTEALKGFYKLRKAFISLNNIMDAEARFLGLQHGSGTVGGASKRPSFSEDPMPGSFDDSEFADMENAPGGDQNGAKDESAKDGNGLEFTDAPEELPRSEVLGGYTGHLAQTSAAASPNGTPTPETATTENSAADVSSGPLESDDTEPSEPGFQTPSIPADVSEPLQRSLRILEHGPDSSLFKNPVDVFIHSGANMCFGILMLMLSMVPPAFSRLLYVVGFKGDRERGIRMLWQSTKFANINGAVAALLLLSFYNGMMSYSDVLLTEDDVAELSEPGEIVGYPKRLCRELLATMRSRYPQSLLWKLEEARSLANSRRLDEAIAALLHNTGGKMRQVIALNKFELSVNAMFAMDWPLMRDSFIECVELNNWSHAIYYYNAGCAEIELYRDAYHLATSLASDEGREKERAAALARAKKHKEVAHGYLRKTPAVAGKKKFMARQMPFEVYVLRKIAKFEERATALGIDLADAVGVSPAQEMTYLFNGIKRMSPVQLEKALSYLSWDRCTMDKQAVESLKAAPDENGIKIICEAALFRSLGRLKEARESLETEVLKHDRLAFKGLTKDDYVLPAANYELASLSWKEATDRSCFPADAAAVDEYRRQKTNECEAYLDKVAKWETFVLDARFGMRVQTGLDSIRWLKKKKNWA